MGPNGSKIQLSRPGTASLEETERGPPALSHGKADRLQNQFVSDVSSTIKRNGIKIGHLQACILHRDQMGPDFHRSLNDTSQELLDFGRLLFDHRGRLRSTYAIPGAVRAGTGLWGHELTSGSLAFVLDIIVRPPFRSQRIEETALDMLIHHLIRTPAITRSDTSWTSPTALIYLPTSTPGASSGGIASGRSGRYNACMNGSDGLDPGTLCCLSAVAKGNADQRRILDLLLEYGFRRVGTSPYLAFSLDVSHPTHHLPKEFDTQPLVRPTGVSANPQKDFPLHFHILALPPPTDFYGQTSELFHLISYIRTAPLSYIQRVDHLGCTPLHLAASSLNLPVLKALLARSRAELSARRYDGLTPLDVLKEEMTDREDRRRVMGADEEDPHEDACLAWFLAAERGR